MGSKQLGSIMAHLESTSVNLDESISKINKTVADGKLDLAMNETVQILTEARRLVHQARSEIDALKLKDKSLRADALLTDIEKNSKAITGALQETSEHLRVTSENLQKLSDSLNRDPSELIFSKPAPPRKILE